VGEASLLHRALVRDGPHRHDVVGPTATRKVAGLFRSTPGRRSPTSATSIRVPNPQTEIEAVQMRPPGAAELVPPVPRLAKQHPHNHRRDNPARRGP